MHSPGHNGAICIVGSLAIEAFLFNFDGLYRCTTQLLLGESTLELLHYNPPCLPGIHDRPPLKASSKGNPHLLLQRKTAAHLPATEGQYPDFA